MGQYVPVVSAALGQSDLIFASLSTYSIKQPPGSSASIPLELQSTPTYRENNVLVS